MILGVCKGLAEYFDVNVMLVRVALVAASIFTAFWPFAITYVVAGVLMKPEPIVPILGESDREFYDSYMSSRSMALQRLKRTFDHLDRRVGRIEDVVTSREYSWEKRLSN
jgi:phage shock protein C